MRLAAGFDLVVLSLLLVNILRLSNEGQTCLKGWPEEPILKHLIWPCGFADAIQTASKNRRLKASLFSSLISMIMVSPGRKTVSPLGIITWLPLMAAMMIRSLGRSSCEIFFLMMEDSVESWVLNIYNPHSLNARSGMAIPASIFSSINEAIIPVLETVASTPSEENSSSFLGSFTLAMVRGIR